MHNLIIFSKYALANPAGCEANTLTKICKGQKTLEDFDPINLSKEAPKIFTFYLQYGDFFNALDEDFKCRKMMVNLLPQSFKLLEIFMPTYEGSNLSLTANTLESVQDSDEYELFGFVGYYGFHYMAFIQQKGIW